MTSFATHLECSRCGEDFQIDTLQQTCTKDGGPLLVRYDLMKVHKAMQREVLARRPATLWRYHELLPMAHPERVVTLGEPNTPLLDAKRIGEELDIPGLRVKDE